MKSTVTVMILAGIVACGGLAQTAPRTRTFHFEYKAFVKDLGMGSRRVELWAPVPHDDEYQRITNLRVDSPYSYKIVTGAHGNTMLHAAVSDTKASAFTLTISFDAVRTEHIQTRLAGGPALTR